MPTKGEIERATKLALENLIPPDGSRIQALRAMNRADKCKPNLSDKDKKEFIQKNKGGK